MRPTRHAVGTWLLVAAAAGCVERVNHERTGDRRYAEGAFTDAVAEYRLAVRQGQSSGELTAKLGHAALRAGVLDEAARSYAELARDPAAVEEAAEGLVRTARAAARVRDLGSLRAAVTALRDVAPSRIGDAVRGLALPSLVTEARGPDAGDLLLVAAAQAATGGAQDSLLAAWADITAGDGRCELATRAYAAVLRRVAPTAAAARQARGGLASCAVTQGRAALAVGALDSALTAFRTAIGLGTPDSTVRLAWVLSGDALWAAGDGAAARQAYLKATANGDPDNPLVQRALEQLERLSGTPAP